MIEAFGGKHFKGGGTAELLEGRQDERRVGLFEFPSMEALRAFWNSPEYVPVKQLRQDVAYMEIWAVPGPLPRQHDV